jgi:hypothetical protein
MRVDATSYPHAAQEILRGTRQGESRYVCVATVNNVIQAHGDHDYGAIMEAADLVTPDGMPLVWGLRLLGVAAATRVYGPDLTPVVCQLASEHGVSIGFYGGTPDTLEALTARLEHRFPGLRIVYRASPPFRQLTPEEERRTVEELDRSGARILFVGVGNTEAGALDGRAQERGERRHAGGRRRVRLPCRQETAGAQAGAAARPRVVVPPSARAPAAVAALPEPESAVRRAVRRAAAAGTTPARRQS